MPSVNELTQPCNNGAQPASNGTAPAPNILTTLDATTGAIWHLCHSTDPDDGSAFVRYAAKHEAKFPTEFRPINDAFLTQIEADEPYDIGTISALLSGNDAAYELFCEIVSRKESPAHFADCIHTFKNFQKATTQEKQGLIGLVGANQRVLENFNSAPEPITPKLLDVPPLPAALIPEPLRAWLADIQSRVSCPLEYSVVPAIIALGTVIGRKVGVRPKQRDSWTVGANIWGATVGTPGAKKTPAASEGRVPLRRLTAEAREQHEATLANWELENTVSEYETKAVKAKLEKAAKGGKSRAELIQILATETPAASELPTERRYEVNDATIEALGERLRENPNGLLVYRDELTGFIKSLDRQGHENDRAFYLEAWNGLGEGYTYDRIGRGTVHIPSVCVSIFGTIQPAPLCKLLRGAANGSEADGFIPRFQMLMYPDPIPYRFVDRFPDTESKNRAFAIYKKLDEMTADDMGAESEEGSIPFLRFSLDIHNGECAQELVNSWAQELEVERLPAAMETPLIESHLAKFRSLMPKLALIFHLVDIADGAPAGAISIDAARRAMTWCDVLEAHARRVYGMAHDTPFDSALALANKIKSGDIARLKSWDGARFKVADVVRNGWASLTATDEVLRAVAVLEARSWVQSVEFPTSENGGRPAEWVYVHPKFLKDEAKLKVSKTRSLEPIKPIKPNLSSKKVSERPKLEPTKPIKPPAPDDADAIFDDE